MKPTPNNYIDNKAFLEAIIIFKKQCKEARDAGKPRPMTKEYEFIGKCVLLIARRLANSPNFISYSFREEMIQDGIMDCIKHIENFDPDYTQWSIYDTNKKEYLRNVEEETKYYDAHKKHRKFKYYKTIEKAKDYLEYALKKNPDLARSDLEIREEKTQNPFSYVTQTCWFANVRRITTEAKQKIIKSEMILNSGILNDLAAFQDGDDETYSNSYLSFLQENLVVDTKEKQEKKKAKRTSKANKKKLDELKDLEDCFTEQLISEISTEDAETLFAIDAIEMGKTLDDIE